MRKMSTFCLSWFPTISLVRLEDALIRDRRRQPKSRIPDPSRLYESVVVWPLKELKGIMKENQIPKEKVLTMTS